MLLLFNTLKINLNFHKFYQKTLIWTKQIKLRNFGWQWLCYVKQEILILNHISFTLKRADYSRFPYNCRRLWPSSSTLLHHPLGMLLSTDLQCDPRYYTKRKMLSWKMFLIENKCMTPYGCLTSIFYQK